MRITEQAKQENRTRILKISEKLFIEKGFEKTTTRDIALAAGLAAGTLFNYFPTKETLAMSMVTEALAVGQKDFERRRTEKEGFDEELFLFISSGLRRLRPLHSFIGPVLERSLSPFPRRSVCREGEAARLAHLETAGQIIGRHGFITAPDHVAMTMYWSLYLGILAFWSNDASPGQGETLALIDYSLRLFVQMISGVDPEQNENLSE